MTKKIQKSVYEMYQDVKRIEVEKLIKAIKSVSPEGKFSFDTAHGEEPTIVAAYVCDEPADVIILSAEITGNDVQFNVTPKEDTCTELEVYASDVFYGHIDYITADILFAAEKRKAVDVG